MIDKNYCMSHYLAFRIIKDENINFYDGLKHEVYKCHKNEGITPVRTIKDIEDVNKIYAGDVLLIPNKLIFKTLNDMYLRKSAGTTGYVKVKNVDDSEKSLLTSNKDNDKAIIKKDSIIEASDIIKKDNGSIWVKIKSGYVCYKGVSGTIYLENYVS